MTATLPLQALRTFVEVSQRGSITAAAQALHVTPGAVSQQIRLLEDRLGIALLVRERHGMRMTEAGAEAYPMLSAAFAQIDKAVDMLAAKQARQSLTVSTVATFAASWLVPRLGRFKERHPHIEIRVEATPALVDLRRDHVDVALRHGLGDYPGLDVVPLMAPVLVPVAAPGFAAALAEPADCLDYPLLHDADRADWPLWLSAHGVAQDARAQRGNAFDDDFLLIRAAEAGQGLALVPAAHAQEEIAAGRLVQALDKPWPARFAYYAVSRPGAVQRPEVRAFIDWIVEEARA
ncbi:LysR family transcriptional regulator [Achromobacter sp. K91]|jgi:LysR family glycine cleavage system transcriptional activator|uniref:Gcv operon activator n=1 Tax=Achromobacter aegrifaciens TaxID=1287736 RepID=A0AAD2IXE7_ACHAE|nr:MULTISPECIES: LysR substrate-binding domain-containing protein [Achromobacter]PTN51485.1 transcriptional regulator [Achromobacter xylosoxidans]MBD9430845.1 LysR family transcriptional regulator [Achromobacter sp. ACM03]MDQ1761978.1 LysR substrate-binding domain-containing protein [Achromobacter aegrifaciens]RII99902.1 LysR family transcriptional regulator [Achromobacter sp. K91]CAB3812309.1 Glycine cleavage system transcriptional activator [Achromobacter aegrifaciens]